MVQKITPTQIAGSTTNWKGLARNNDATFRDLTQADITSLWFSTTGWGATVWLDVYTNAFNNTNVIYGDIFGRNDTLHNTVTAGSGATVLQSMQCVIAWTYVFQINRQNNSWLTRTWRILKNGVVFATGNIISTGAQLVWTATVAVWDTISINASGAGDTITQTNFRATSIKEYTWFSNYQQF